MTAAHGLPGLAEFDERRRGSPLARSSGALKLLVAVAWLAALAAVDEPVVALRLGLVAGAAAIAFGRVSPVVFLRALAPLLVAVASIAVTTLVFAAANGDATIAEVVRLGPFRLTQPAIDAAGAIAARIGAIVVIGAAFAQTTEPTSLVDALVQQARLDPRFAYGALAAYQAVPRLASDLATIRSARRVRGVGWGWHPRILVTLLVRAIRHADQLALAMDARGFGTGPRTTFRPIRWNRYDVGVALVGLAATWWTIAG